jgi:O-antigen/teichoic acid export membrane protein
MSGILYAVIMLLVGISLVPHYGINGYWISLISADIFSVIYIAFRIKLKDYLQINLISKNTVNEMLRYSVPLIPNATMWWIVNSINRPILVSSVGLDGVGLYAVAGKFPSILSVLFAIFFGSFQISAIEEYNKDSFNSFYNKIFKLQLFPQIFAVIIFELLGCVLFHIFVDEKYYAAERYLPLFCCGVLLSNVAMYVGVCFTVIKKTKYMLYSAIIAAVVAVVANYCLIPLYGIYGACISVLLSQFSMIAFRYIQSSKIETLHIDSSVILQISILSISLIVFYLVKPKLIANGLIVLLLFLLCFIQRRSIIHIFNFIKTKYIK